jgi:two-component system, NtrC family, response regulator AtoC
MVLEGAGHRLIESRDCSQALLLLSNGLDPDLLLVESTPANSLETEQLRQLLNDKRKHEICMILGMGELAQRREAAERGVKRFLTKPVTRGDLESMIGALNPHVPQGLYGNTVVPSADSAKQARRMTTDAPAFLRLEELGEGRFFLGASPQMLEIYRQVKLLADVDVNVLILGESGTGKEVIAHLIYKHSRRSSNRFENVNCAALPEGLLESELFGCRKGAFTGAIRDTPGKFELANRGTLLLDEIGEMSAPMQAKLLHVLEDGHFTRLGGQEPTKVDVRVLAATNVQMESELAEKTFREDLYYRLGVFTIHVPPLRERREEIPYLIEETIRRAPGETKSGKGCSFCPRLMDAACRYEWRGNIRELRNFVTRTIILNDQDAAIRELEIKIAAASGVTHREISCGQLSRYAGMRPAVREVKNRTEMQMIENALNVSGWHRLRAAQLLDISYRSLLYKIAKYHLAPRSAAVLKQAS